MVGKTVTVIFLGLFVFANAQVPMFSEPESVGNIDSVELDEASGCGFSRINPNIMYSHNDHGDSARLFAVDVTTASVMTILTISGADHNDWEDMAVGPCSAEEEDKSCIYILDDGEVDDSSAMTIYKVVEPEIDDLTEVTVEVEAVLRYNWSEPQSCTLMVDASGYVYVIGNVNGGRGMMASISPDMWGQTEAIDISSTAFFAMESTHHDPASGDISPDGREVLVKHREQAFYYAPADGDIIAALTLPGSEVPLADERLGEAICWNADASAYYTLAEGAHQILYKYTRLPGSEETVG